MWATTLWEHGSPALQWGIVSGASLIAASTDLAARRIPNWLTFPLLISGLIASGFSAGAAGLADSLAAMVIMALPYVLLFLFAQGGAGDAKLMGAIGAWLGVINGCIALTTVAAMGVVLAIVYAAARKRTRDVAVNVAAMSQGLVTAALTKTRVQGTLSTASATKPMLTMPYGVAIFLGVGVSAVGVLLWRM